MNGQIRRAVAAAGLIALALRLARLYEAPTADPFYAVYLLDSAYYNDMARALLGQGPAWDGPYLMAPLYGYFLAAIYAVRDALSLEQGPGLVYAVQVGLGAATASLSAVLGGRLGGRVGAWTAGLLFALYPVAVIYDVKLLSVTLATFLATAGAVLFLRAWDRLGAGEAAGGAALAAGLALGLATIARGNLIFSLPFLVLMAAWRGRSSRAGWLGVGLLTLGLALPLGATFAHNASAGSGALVSVNGGINLYRGNNPYFVSEAVEPFRLPAERDGLATRSRLVASVESDRWLTEREADQYWSGRALAHWAEDPVRYIGLTLRKAEQVLSWKEVQDNVDHDYLARRSAVLSWIPPTYGVMVSLGLAGVALLARRRQHAPLLVLLITGIGGIALFFVVARYRVPLVPLWAACSGAAVAEAARRWRAGERGVVYRGAAAVAALCGLLTLPPTSAVWPWSWLVVDRAPPECLLDPHLLRAPELESRYGAAFRLLVDGDLSAAEAGMREVWQADPQHYAAGVNLSYLLLQRGDAAGAARVASDVLKGDPCEEKAWMNLGNALLKQGQIPGGLGALHKAVEVDPYDPEMHAALGHAWLLAGNKTEARAALEFAVRWDPKGWKARALLARIALQERGMDEAARLLDEALALAPDQVDLYGMRGLAALGNGDLEGAAETLKRGEEAQQRLGGRPDPVLAALRAALDKPFELPENFKPQLSVRTGLGP